MNNVTKIGKQERNKSFEPKCKDKDGEVLEEYFKVEKRRYEHK